MTGSEYQKLAMRTCNLEDTDDMLYHAIFGLTSEAGEVSGIMQKYFQGHYISTLALLKELGDCLWMISEACEALGFTLDDIMDINIEKLRKRYPNGFEAERSLHRAEDDI